MKRRRKNQKSKPAKKAKIEIKTIELLPVEVVCGTNSGLPEPRLHPQPNPQPNIEDISIISFDLETTGLGSTCEIIQIGACCEDETFMIYTLPLGPIQMSATWVHGITCKDGKLYQRKEPVDSVDLKSGLESFLAWIKKFPNPVLVAHNGERFDFSVILRQASEHGLLEDFTSTLYALSDTLMVFKAKHPKLPSYSLDNLITKFGVENFKHHDALEDSIALQKLIQKSKKTTAHLLEYGYTMEYLIDKREFKQATETQMESFERMVDKGIMPRAAALRAAQSGLNLAHLQSTYDKHGEPGLATLLQQQLPDCVRVTKQKKDVERILNYFYCLSNPQEQKS